MRIVGGDLRGKQINPPVNFKARPTTDFAKEGLFNILSNQYDFEEISVLDLFSGTGSISFEFASRGCKDITAVEMNPLHASSLIRDVNCYARRSISSVSPRVPMTVCSRFRVPSRTWPSQRPSVRSICVRQSSTGPSTARCSPRNAKRPEA